MVPEYLRFLGGNDPVLGLPVETSCEVPSIATDPGMNFPNPESRPHFFVNHSLPGSKENTI